MEVSYIRVRRDQDKRDRYQGVVNISRPRAEFGLFLETEKWKITRKPEKKDSKSEKI